MVITVYPSPIVAQPAEQVVDAVVHHWSTHTDRPPCESCGAALGLVTVVFRDDSFEVCTSCLPPAVLLGLGSELKEAFDAHP